MKHRITYLRGPSDDDDFDPRQTLKVWKNSMRVSGLVTAKEHRVTLNVSDLPDELAKVLRQCVDLHLRWTSTCPYRAITPLVSRAPPGLHVLYSSVERSHPHSLCPDLKTIFGASVNCDPSEKSFMGIPAKPGSNPPLHQWYTFLPSLQGLSEYITKSCTPSDEKCLSAAMSLLSADYIDIDYEKDLGSVILTSFWATGPQEGTWEEIIDYSSHERVEVGLLHQEASEDKDEIKMGGWLTVVGHDKNPKSTLFGFPSRHHALPPKSTFHTTFDTPTGLHPTLRIFLSPSALAPPNPTCSLHAYLNLPSSLFIDRHAFGDALFLRSHNLAGLNSLGGATDLEAPDWVIKQWGSAVLFDLATNVSTTSPATAGLKVTIPLHLRYLSPAVGGYTNITLPYPAVFWACKSASDSFKPTGNPFDRIWLGYDAEFDERTIFQHVQPIVATGATSAISYMGNDTGRLALDVRVPVLDLEKAWYVEGVTGLVVGLGLMWVLWKCFRPVKATSVSKGKTEKTRTS